MGGLKIQSLLEGEVRIDQGEEMYGALMRSVNGGMLLIEKLFVMLIVALSSVLAACSSIMTLQVYLGYPFGLA